MHWCIGDTVMPIRQWGIRNPVFICACCSRVHFGRCLCHALHHSLVIKCVFESVQNDGLWFPIAVDGCSAAPVIVVVSGFLFLLGESQFDQALYVCVSDTLKVCKISHQPMDSSIGTLQEHQSNHNRWKKCKVQWGLWKPMIEWAASPLLKHRRMKWFKVRACFLESYAGAALSHLVWCAAAAGNCVGTPWRQWLYVHYSDPIGR